MANRRPQNNGRRMDYGRNDRAKNFGRGGVSPWQGGGPTAGLPNLLPLQGSTEATLALANNLITNLLQTRQAPVPSLLDMPIRRDFGPDMGRFDHRPYGFNNHRVSERQCFWLKLCCIIVSTSIAANAVSNEDFHVQLLRKGHKWCNFFHENESSLQLWLIFISFSHPVEVCCVLLYIFFIMILPVLCCCILLLETTVLWPPLLPHFASRNILLHGAGYYFEHAFISISTIQSLMTPVPLYLSATFRLSSPQRFLLTPFCPHVPLDG